MTMVNGKFRLERVNVEFQTIHRNIFILWSGSIHRTFNCFRFILDNYIENVQTLAVMFKAVWADIHSYW